MNRQAMREKVLGEMVVARDLEIARLNLVLERASRLCVQQGDKILELLELSAKLSTFDMPRNLTFADGGYFINGVPVVTGEVKFNSSSIPSGTIVWR